MGKPQSSACQAYDPSLRKTFQSAVGHLLQTEFPSVFGPLITELFVTKIDELYERFHPPASRFKLGQILWAGVAANDPPARDKRIERCQLIPLILDLVTAQDIDESAASGKRPQTRRNKIVRLLRQSFEQGAVLSLADVSLLLHVNIGTISHEITAHERQTQDVLPRRGTIHDLGRSVTHKAIICYKRLVEHKSTSQVAQETFHSHTEVEYYVQCLRRIHLCRDSGMSKEDTALATGHSLSLVQEYLELIDQFGLPRLTNPPGKDGVQTGDD
jgi:hypothetical protein